MNGNLGYINLLDALNAWQLVKELSFNGKYKAAASFKHTAPAGAAIGKYKLTENEMKCWDVKEVNSELGIAFIRARQADPLSSFGDFIALSDTVDEETALLIKREVSDGVIAPGYTDDAYKILSSKRGGKYLILKIDKEYVPTDSIEFREIYGIGMSQVRNTEIVMPQQINNWVTNSINGQDKLNQAIEDLYVANCTLKYTPSNSIVYAYNGQVIGVGAGQQNRVDCVKLAGDKAVRWWKRLSPCFNNPNWDEKLKRQEKVNMIMDFVNYENSNQNIFNKTNDDDIHLKKLQNDVNFVLASDAFFPFSDNIYEANRRGVKFIMQPGGSLADNDIINACNDKNISMCLSGKRMFLH